MIEYSSIYKNGKIERFFIKTENAKEFNFIQPYFLLTSLDKKRNGNILEMDCLFSGSVWQGRQRHGWGYSSSHDVFIQLLENINKLYKNKLTEEAQNELKKINTHDDKINLSEETLSELDKLNGEYLAKKWGAKND